MCVWIHRCTCIHKYIHMNVYIHVNIYTFIYMIMLANKVEQPTCSAAWQRYKLQLLALATGAATCPGTHSRR